MSWLLLDYVCSACGAVTEYFADRAQPERCIDCECGDKAERAVSAPHVKTQTVWVETGNNEPRPPHILNTEKFAKG